MNRWFAVLFLGICAVQLAVPGRMILRRETVLREGEVFRFETRPVDPYDAFRGRYVALSFTAEAVTNLPAAEGLRRGARVWAELAVDGDGYAHVAGLTPVRPEQGPCIPVRVRWSGNEQATIRFPFDRFYLEESVAPAAEAAYRRNASRDANRETYALVRVRNGFPVLEDLVVNGQPILAAVKAGGN